MSRSKSPSGDILALQKQPHQSPQVSIATTPGSTRIDTSCQFCHAPSSLYTDWAQGDLVCTSCGVVHTQHIMDTSAEWREYENDDKDSQAYRARAGFVPTNDTKYLGGLQPTTLSKFIFRRSANDTKGQSSIQLRRQLVKTNRKMNRLMEKQHHVAHQKASWQLKTKHLRQQQQKRSTHETDTVTDAETNSVVSDVDPYSNVSLWTEDDIRPELEDTVRRSLANKQQEKQARYVEKWSLERAKAIHENSDNDNSEELELEPELKLASQRLYTAYQLLTKAANRLELPVIITDEAVSRLCQYATVKDGLKVRGVGNTTPLRHRQTLSKEQKEHDRQVHRVRQMGSLCAALIFWTARNHQRPRALVEVCNNVHLREVLETSETIQKRHCSRAMTELRECFPQWARSSSVPGGIAASQDSIPAAIAVRTNVSTSAVSDVSIQSVSNFCEHCLRQLNLPPVADAATRYLAARVAQDQKPNGKNLSVLCAAVAYLVCRAGSTMQELASQATTVSDREKKKRSSQTSEGTERSSKKVKTNPSTEPLVKTEPNQKKVFDIFDMTLADASREHREYEMRRVYDAWSEQLSWSRTLTDLERATDASQTAISDFYKEHVHPNRRVLLQSLSEAASENEDSNKDASLSSRAMLAETPLASLLLPQIKVSAAIMKDVHNATR